MRKLTLFILIAAGLAASPAFGDMKITIADVAGIGTTNGGPDLVTVRADRIGNYGNLATFETFCLENHEYLAYGPIYTVTISDHAIWGGVGPAGDPLSAETAWIYTKWLDGTIDHTSENADAVQRAIWFAEEEASGDKNWLYDDAHDAVLAGWQNRNVRVMNVWSFDNSDHLDPNYVTGPRRQDLLVMVPAPGAALLAVIGLGLIGWLKRRIA